MGCACMATDPLLSSAVFSLQCWWEVILQGFVFSSFYQAGNGAVLSDSIATWVSSRSSLSSCGGVGVLKSSLAPVRVEGGMQSFWGREGQSRKREKERCHILSGSAKTKTAPPAASRDLQSPPRPPSPSFSSSLTLSPPSFLHVTVRHASFRFFPRLASSLASR